MQKIIAKLLCLFLIISILPANAFASGTDYTGLVEAVSNARSTRDMANILSEYEYFSDTASDVFYPHSVYARMYRNNNYATAEQIVAAWDETLAVVKANPDVSLYSKSENTRPFASYTYNTHADRIAVYANSSNGNSAYGMQEGMNKGASAFFTTDVPNGRYRVTVTAATQNDVVKIKGYLANANADFTSPFKEDAASVPNKGWFEFTEFELGFVDISDTHKIIGINILNDIVRVSSINLYLTDNSVTKPSLGINTVKISKAIRPGAMVIAAMYQDNSLYEAISDYTDGTEKTLTFTKEVTDEDAVCKVFFWNGVEYCRPLEFSELIGMDTVYVSEDGNDNASGTHVDPFRTLKRAQQFVRSASDTMLDDITVNIMPGTYFIDEKLTFTTEDGGKNGYSVVYKGIGDTKPVISGGIKLENNWTDSDGDGIYQISVPQISEARQMYINGFAAKRASSDVQYIGETGGYKTPGSSYTTDGFFVRECDFPDFKHPEELEVVTHCQWALCMMPVKDVFKLAGTSDTVFLMDQPGYNYYMNTTPQPPSLPEPGCRFTLENAIEFLDQEGEFYFDKTDKILYYKPYAQEDLTTAEIYLPRSEGLIDITGTESEPVENIRFENLDFRHGAYNEMSARGGFFVQADSLVKHDEAMTNWSGSSDTIMCQINVEHAEGIDIVDCNLSELGSAAIGMIHNVSDSSVRRNTIHDISATSVVVGSWRYGSSSNPDTLCNNITIENNLITRTGQEFMGTPGIGVYYAKDISILHNDINDTPYTGITLGWGWGSTTPKTLGCGNYIVKGNKIQSTSRVMRDGGDIYSLGDLAGSVISDNYLIGNNDMASIYLDNGSENITVKNNVCENYTNRWLYINTGAANNTISSNYVSGSKTAYADNGDNNTITGTTKYYSYYMSDTIKNIMNTAGLTDDVTLSVDQRHSYIGTAYSGPDIPEYCGEDDYILEAENASSKSVSSSTPGESTRGRYTLGFSADKAHYLSYDVNVKKAGTYTLLGRFSSYLDSQVATTEPVYLKVSVNGIETNVTVPKTNTQYGTYPSNYIGKYELVEGKNTIKITNAGRGIAIDNFKLCYPRPISTGKENAITYDSPESAKNQMASGTNTWFELGDITPGKYLITAKVAAATDSKARFDVYIDNGTKNYSVSSQKFTKIDTQGKGIDEYSEIIVGIYDFTSSDTHLCMALNSGSCALGSISLFPLSDDTKTYLYSDMTDKIIVSGGGRPSDYSTDASWMNGGMSTGYAAWIPTDVPAGRYILLANVASNNENAQVSAYVCTAFNTGYVSIAHNVSVPYGNAWTKFNEMEIGYVNITDSSRLICLSVSKDIMRIKSITLIPIGKR